MPVPTREEDRYGDRFLAGLVKDAFDSIVYTGINHFDQVFAELDWIVTGSPSTMLPEISDLFNNEYQVVEADELGWPKAQQLATLYELITKRAQAEKDAYFPLPQRIQKLEEQAKLQAAKQAKLEQKDYTAELLGQPRLPSNNELQQMVCLAIEKLCDAIHEYLRTLRHGGTSLEEAIAVPENLEYRIHVIFNALNMSHEANVIKRNLRVDLYKLGSIKELLQSGVITAHQFRKFDPAIKTYLAQHRGIANEVPIRISQPNLMVYIQCRKILSEFNPDIDFSNIGLAYINADASNTKNLGAFRNMAVALFAEHCGITISQDTIDKEVYCQLHELLFSISRIATHFNLSLPELYAYDEDVIISAWTKREALSDLIIAAAIPVQRFLIIAPKALDLLLDNADKVSAQCAHAGISLHEFLSLPTEALEFILSNLKNLQKMAMLLKGRTVTKEQFLAADLTTMRAWFKRANSNIHYVFDLITAPEKQYEDILDTVKGQEFVSYNGQSVYACALAQNDPTLIDIITNIMLEGYNDGLRRSVGYLHAFLTKNKFKAITPAPSTDITWHYHKSTPVSNSALNARNPEGDTPLLVAIKQDDYIAALMLLVSGANVHLTGKDRLMPLELARRLGRVEMVQDLAQTERYLIQHRVLPAFR